MSKKPTVKQAKFIEGVVAGKSGAEAARDAGYSPKTAKEQASRLLTNINLFEAVERRKKEAMRRAQIHTDVIVGSLAEIAMASLADVNPDDPFLRKAQELGTDHLIKKMKIIYDKQGSVTSREFEMYSRLDALNQLRDNFGMKQEPRRNTYAEIEAAVKEFKEKANALGYEITDEEARQYIAPRMQESQMVN